MIALMLGLLSAYKFLLPLLSNVKYFLHNLSALPSQLKAYQYFAIEPLVLTEQLHLFLLPALGLTLMVGSIGAWVMYSHKKTISMTPHQTALIQSCTILILGLLICRCLPFNILNFPAISLTILSLLTLLASVLTSLAYHYYFKHAHTLVFYALLLLIWISNCTWLDRPQNETQSIEQFKASALNHFPLNNFLLRAEYLPPDKVYLDVISPKDFMQESFLQGASLNLLQFKHIEHFQLSIKGKVIKKTQLTLMLDQRIIHQVNLVPGMDEVSLNFPLDKGLLTIRVDKASFKVSRIYLANKDLSNTQKITPDQSAKACQQLTSSLLCHIHATSETELIELPFFYYNDLVAVKINHQPVPIKIINRFGYAIIAVQPIDQENKIEAQYAFSFHPKILQGFSNAKKQQ